MNKPLVIKTAVYSLSFLTGTAATLAYTAYITQHQKKIDRLEFENELDVIAIRRARDLMLMRLNNGQYPVGTLSKLMSDMKTEMELQKIAIRQD